MWPLLSLHTTSNREILKEQLLMMVLTSSDREVYLMVICARALMFHHSHMAVTVGTGYMLLRS